MLDRKRVIGWIAVLLFAATAVAAAQGPEPTQKTMEVTPELSALALEIFGPPLSEAAAPRQENGLGILDQSGECCTQTQCAPCSCIPRLSCFCLC